MFQEVFIGVHEPDRPCIEHADTQVPSRSIVEKTRQLHEPRPFVKLYTGRAKLHWALGLRHVYVMFLESAFRI
jgi:hypothetical protein